MARQAHMPDIVTKTGPWGGSTGHEFNDGFTAAGICKIVINASSDYVDKLTLEYVGSDGKNKTTSHGGSGGISHEIVLEFPKEVLTHIEGHYGYHRYFGPPNHIGILSLGFTTSTGKQYGPYGNTKDGTFFSSEVAPKILGFFGRAGTLVDAVGVFTPPKVKKIGPWGGISGNEFDDGFTTAGISKIVINASSDYVDKLTVEYVGVDGKTKITSHGGSGGISQKIILEYPNEVVTHIEGHYGNHRYFGPPYHIGILSLGFTTSMGKKYGPYGNTKDGTFFSWEVTPKILGFFGHAGNLIDAIGVFSV